MLEVCSALHLTLWRVHLTMPSNHFQLRQPSSLSLNVNLTWSTVLLTTWTQLQKRKEEYDALREQRHRFQSALDTFDAINQDELQRLEMDIHKLSMSGHQSEPTTPPDHRDNRIIHGNRVNRLSLASMAPTPGVGSIASPRATRPGSQGVNTPFLHNTASNLPSFSVPQSRRGSDEEGDGFSSLDFTAVSRRAHG